MHETIVSNRPSLPSSSNFKEEKNSGKKSSRVPFSGIIARGELSPPPFTVFTFNFTESNVTRGSRWLSKWDEFDCPVRFPWTWTWRRAAADRIRPVRECRTEGERHKNEPAPRDLFTRGKVTAFIQYLTRRARREEFKPAVGRRLATTRFFPIYRSTLYIYYIITLYSEERREECFHNFPRWNSSIRLLPPSFYRPSKRHHFERERKREREYFFNFASSSKKDLYDYYPWKISRFDYFSIHPLYLRLVSFFPS